MSQQANPRETEAFTDRAIIIDANEDLIQIQVFNEAGFITKVLLDTTEIMGIQTALKWATDQCNQKLRNQ